MNDHNDDTGPRATIGPDSFATFQNFLALIADPAAFKKRMRELEKTLAAIEEGQAKLVADRVMLDQDRQRHAAKIEADTAELDRQTAALVTAPRQKLEQLLDSLLELERRYTPVGEELLGGGQRAPENDGLSPLQRVRVAVGLDAGPSQEDFLAAMAEANRILEEAPGFRLAVGATVGRAPYTEPASHRRGLREAAGQA